MGLSTHKILQADQGKFLPKRSETMFAKSCCTQQESDGRLDSIELTAYISMTIRVLTIRAQEFTPIFGMAASIPQRKVFLDRFEYIPLIPVTTPVVSLPNITNHLRESGAQQIEVYIKRDDLTGVAGGGNKLRKLEFLLSDAIESGFDTIITAGGLQSNHCRQTAGAAARLGLQVHLVLNRNVEGRVPLYHESGNLVLNELFGAKMHVHPAKINRTEKMEELAAELQGQGRKPYIIPVGGSNALGALGYVKCAFELFGEQYPLFRPSDPAQAVTVLCATSSYGTLAGITVGISMLRASGRLDRASIKAVGVRRAPLLFESCTSHILTIKLVSHHSCRQLSP
jgi:hypothetical protein